MTVAARVMTSNTMTSRFGCSDAGTGTLRYTW
jgi:hypothetical protein